MVPFMRASGYDIRKSIGTAAAVGFLIAVSGTITMISGGKIIDNLNTPFSVGYINLLGFLVFVPVTMVTARLGAKAVYKIDKYEFFGGINLLILEYEVDTIETPSGTFTASELGWSTSEREYDAFGLNYKLSIGYSF